MLNSTWNHSYIDSVKFFLNPNVLRLSQHNRKSNQQQHYIPTKTYEMLCSMMIIYTQQPAYIHYLCIYYGMKILCIHKTKTKQQQKENNPKMAVLDTKVCVWICRSEANGNKGSQRKSSQSLLLGKYFCSFWLEVNGNVYLWFTYKYSSKTSITKQKNKSINSNLPLPIKTQKNTPST